jgi:hypothetical protein
MKTWLVTASASTQLSRQAVFVFKPAGFEKTSIHTSTAAAIFYCACIIFSKPQRLICQRQNKKTTMRSAVAAVAALRGSSHPAAALSSLSQLYNVTATPADASTAQGLRSITHSSSAHHSSPHTHQPEQDVQQLQQQLLQDALQHVKQHGWTRASLAAAAADLQLSPAAVGMFPRGPSQLVEHYIAQQNAQLEQELQEQQQQYLALPLRQRIAAAVRRRLELNAAHMDSWPQVCAFGASSLINTQTRAAGRRSCHSLRGHCTVPNVTHPLVCPSLCGMCAHLQALALVSQPPNAPAALRLLTQLLDTIWCAGTQQKVCSCWWLGGGCTGQGVVAKTQSPELMGSCLTYRMLLLTLG